MCLTCIVKKFWILGPRLQRWSPGGRSWLRGRPKRHILKALASNVKSLTLASKPQVLENFPDLGSRTALFFKLLKFCRSLKILMIVFFLEIVWKIAMETAFFGDRLKYFFKNFFLRSLAACVLGPWPPAFLSLASRQSVLERAGLNFGYFCVFSLEPGVLDCTSAPFEGTSHFGTPKFGPLFYTYLP